MKAKHAYSCALELLQHQQYPQALEILERGAEQVRQQADWSLLRLPFELVPTRLLDQPRWAYVYSAVLTGLRNEQQLLDFSDRFLPLHPLSLSAPVLGDAAWALSNQGRFAEAQQALEAALPHLTGWRLGVAWCRLGRCYFELSSEWQQAFGRAQGHLSGRLKGLALMEEANCLEKLGRYDEHRQRLFEALPLVEYDPFYLAWVRYSLGQSFLRELHPDAEWHLKLAEELSRQKPASGFRSRALQGLGDLYRSTGEWLRAEAAYLEAIDTAKEPEDLRTAYWSLGRCYRLQRHNSKSVEFLLKSIHLSKSPSASVQVDLAATWLTMEKTEEAGVILNGIRRCLGNEFWIARILHAEIARRVGDLKPSLQLLNGLPCGQLPIREETSCWPELFEAIKRAGGNVPKPLPYKLQNIVRVEALGTLKVWVNDRPVPVRPTSRVGELLVLLMENAPRTSSEKLIELLWPGCSPKSKRQALWQLVNHLRSALGWPDSVRAPGGVLELDPTTRWEYDVAKARVEGRSTGPFLEGIYSEWALEVATEFGAVPLHKEVNWSGGS